MRNLCFQAIDDFNSEKERISSVLIPSMGTGVGKIPFSVAARQMRAAYEDIVLKRFKYPEDFGDAQQTHVMLCSDYYFKLLSKNEDGKTTTN